MSILWQIALGAIAVNHVTELIRHGTIFARLREWLALHGEKGGFLGLLSEGVHCGFCFSHWIGIAVVFGCLWTHNVFFQQDATWSPIWLVVASAVIRLAQLLNDATYSFNRMHESEPPLNLETDDDD